MTKIIFTFDTEDFVNDFTADSILRAARLLREAGAKGCFQIVGLLAEALVKWGRQDVIDELKEHHEIGFHSHTHSVHPNLVELTDIQDYGVALKNLLERETEGARKVKEIFGRNRLMSAVKSLTKSSVSKVKMIFVTVSSPLFLDYSISAILNQPIFRYSQMFFPQNRLFSPLSLTNYVFDIILIKK